MSAQHTPGRLVVRGGYSIYTEGLTPVADTCIWNSETANDEANARRLAACWNACDGISTENLESNRPVKELAELCNAELSQRDELLKARQVLGEENIALKHQQADMLAALIVARKSIGTDRNLLAECCTDSEGLMDPADAAFVAEYDAVLLQIDAAIQKATPATPTQPAQP